MANLHHDEHAFKGHVHQSELVKPSYRFGGELPAALAHLGDLTCWVAWEYVLKNGRWTKPPRDPRTGRGASVSDPQSWATFDVALAGMERHGLDGVGLVLTAEDDLTGIDLDDCITDPGSRTPLAAEIIGYGESYAEVSPSGEGIRIFIRGKIERAIKDGATGVEVYSTGRYLTVTGNQVDGTPSEIRPAPRTLGKLTAIVGRAREAKRPKSNGKVHAAGADFFANVNAEALDRLNDWVPALHPTARKQPNGAWRVTSKDLGRDFEEDLAYHPDGIRDHGEERGLTAIDAVVHYGNVSDAKAAAMWLCQKLGIEPARLGWKGKRPDLNGGADDRPDTDYAPDMSVIKRNKLPAPKFPLDIFGPAEDWVKATAEAKNAPVDYVGLGLLVAAAGAIGPKRRVSPWVGWDEPSILWGALVGPPSFIKSPSIDPMRDAVRAIERGINGDWAQRQAQFETDKKVAEAKRDAWEKAVAAAIKDQKEPPKIPDDAVEPKAPTKVRVWIVDATTEKVARILAENPTGLLCFRDELAGLLGGFDKYGGSGSDRAFWIEAYGGRPHRHDRVSLDEVIDIPFCAVSLLGSIQPDRLNSLLLRGDDDGLVSRPLYAWPDPVPPRRPSQVPDRYVLQAALQRLWSLGFDRGEDGTDQPRTVLLESDAADEFQAWWERKQWEAKLAADGRLAGAVGKLEGIALRLAQVLEFLVWAWRGSNTAEPERISVASVRNVLRLVDEWVRPNLDRVFAEASLPQPQRDAATIGKWLLKYPQEKINARDLRRQAGFPGPREAKELDAALEVLADARWLIQPELSAPGRPRKDFIVNPAIYEAR
jgi:hypothetical protein